MTQLIGHSCKISDHLIQEKTVKSPASNREFLCRYLMNHVRNNLKSPIKAIQIIIEELGCRVPQSTMSEALGLAISKLAYDESKGFGHLTSYVSKINQNCGYAVLETIPISPTEEDLEENDEIEVELIERIGVESCKFFRIFISLPVHISMGRLCNFISIDAAHLKGKNNGLLMAATTQDSNSKISLLAYAIVPTENYESWNFFLRNFIQAHPSSSLSFVISDRDKGLQKAWKENYPNIPHSKCLRHLSENFKKKFHSQELTNILKSAAIAFKPEEFESHMNILRAHEKGREIDCWINDAQPELWIRFKFLFLALGLPTVTQ
jgi:hypothetical protein